VEQLLTDIEQLRVKLGELPAMKSVSAWKWRKVSRS
jgi:hypothetical protein